MRDDRAFLNDILERIQLTEEFIQTGKDEFFTSRLIQEAVLRNFEVIGEAARNLSDNLRTQHPEVEWKGVLAFRNFLAHMYWAVKLERVWDIIQNDLLPLKTRIEAILNDLDQAQDATKE